MKVLIINCLVFMLLAGNLNAQVRDSIRWVDWEKANEYQEKEAKKMMVYVYTDWCSWCKKLENTTLREANLAKYINSHFYTVFFDAEQEGDLEYQGKTYHFSKTGKRGHHELAAALLSNRMSYPTIVFLDEEGRVIQSIVGFKTAEQLEKIVTYFATNQYMKMPWSMYDQSYQPVLIKD